MTSIYTYADRYINIKYYITHYLTNKYKILWEEMSDRKKTKTPNMCVCVDNIHIMGSINICYSNCVYWLISHSL